LHVKRATKDTMHYLAKYMTKENDLTPGMRKWATLGGFAGTKTCNVECESELSRNIRYCQEAMNGAQFTYAFFLYLSKLTTQYGEIKDWPKVKRLNCNRPENWQTETVRAIQNRESERAPDDDGRFDNGTPFRKTGGFATVTTKTEYGWSQKLIIAPANPRDPY